MSVMEARIHGRRVLWRAVVEQTAKDLAVDNAAEWAASISYYAILSVFPLLLAGVSIAAYFVDAQWAADRVTNQLAEFVPAQGRQTIREIIANTVAERGTASLIAIPVFLWSGSRVFQTLTKALNVFFDADEHYGFWKQRLVELLMLLSVGVLFLFALSSGLLFDLLHNGLRVLHIPDAFFRGFLRWVLPTTLLLLSYYLLYRFVPRVVTQWRGSLAGAALATALFLVARPLFGEYVRRFANFDGVYGPPAVLIVLLIWVWLVAVITLIGAEFASHFQMIILEGRDPEEVGRRHRWRAPDKRKADRLAAE